MFGKAAFVCRLVPVHRLSVDLVLNIIKDVLEDMMASGGHVVTLFCDNHPINSMKKSSHLNSLGWAAFTSMHDQQVIASR